MHHFFLHQNRGCMVYSQIREMEAEVSGLHRDKHGALFVPLWVAVLLAGRGHQDLHSTSETWLSLKWEQLSLIALQVALEVVQSGKREP